MCIRDRLMSNKLPTSILIETAPSLQEIPEGYEEQTGYIDREPAMSSGTAAAITTLVMSGSIILKHTYGIEIGGEVIDAIVDGVLVVVNFVAPLLLSLIHIS